MDNLLFSLNATVPIFLTMLLGLLFRHMGLFDDAFVKRMNTFVFRVALPVLLFEDLSTADFYAVWDTGFVLFCFAVTFVCIGVAIALSFLLRDRTQQGEFVQGAYRSSAAILGIAFIQNIYGSSGMAPLMIIGTVPLYNVMAVVVLSLMHPQRGRFDAALLKKTCIGVLKNPIIWGIVIGLAWSLLRLPMPRILEKTVGNVATLATPLGLMAMGATFDLKKAKARVKPALCASALKLVGFCAVFVPLAVLCGFRQEKLVAILVMLGSATTVSSFVMARSMGHEGTLSASIVMITTAFSAFTLTTWLFLLRTLGLI